MNNPNIAGGLAVAIIANGNVVYKKGFGFADIENNIPFTTSTICDYASIAKQFTGFAIAKLFSPNKILLLSL
ncbi:MAG: serine hydrolase domain-containing protein [Melioribacteraceae bacterium]